MQVDISQEIEAFDGGLLVFQIAPRINRGTVALLCLFWYSVSPETCCGKPAFIARKIYAFLLFCIAVLIIGYITGFFAKTIAPLVPLTEAQLLLIFGGVTLVYTLFGGLIGVVFTDVVHFFILLIGNLIFFLEAHLRPVKV